MDYKWIHADKYGGYIALFNKLFLSINQRAGKKFVIDKSSCIYPINIINPPSIRCQQIYIQLGTWSFEVSWKKGD